MTATTAMPTYVERSIPFTVTRSTDEGGDGLTFEGYGAVFNSSTRIDSWEGTFDEEIAPGAFKKTLRERTPVFQFDHGRHPLVGSIPIGAIREIREDDRGLFVKARLSDNWLVQPVREAIANGSISGMSFRFEPVKDEWYDKDGKRITSSDELLRLLWGEDPERTPLRRVLREVKMHEVGPVVFPAYPDTTAAVRSQARQLAEAIRSDTSLVRDVRAALAAEKPAAGFRLQGGVSSVEIARALLFDREVAASDPAPPAVPSESTVDSERDEQNVGEDFVRQAAADMIHTSDVGTCPMGEPTEDGEANRTGEPPLGHSETRSPDEPPLGHSEPDAPPHPGATPSLSARGMNLDAEERRLARLRRAEAIRGRLADGLSRSERYTNA